MTKTKDTYIDALKPRAIDLGLAVVETGWELSEWRREAGAKSKWSAHTKLLEHKKFTAFSDATKALGDFFQEYLPAHWGLQDWAFRASRMGSDIRWAGKGGRATGGTTVNIDRQQMSSFVGQTIGLIIMSRRRTGLKRMNNLGLSASDVNLFSLKSYRCHHEAVGHTPSDAYANLIMRGEMGSFGNPPITKTVDQSFEHGYSIADSVTRSPCPISWSAGPQQWVAFRKDPRVRKLAGPASKHKPLNPIWAKHDFATFDATIVMLKEMLETVRSTRGDLQSFLIQTGEHWGIGAAGWCGTSAIIQHAIREIEGGKLPTTIQNWRVFAAASEEGQLARDIAAKDIYHPAPAG
jgi:hypothetical protein